MPPLMKKAIITDNLPTFRPEKFCWHDCFLLPHESLWSILHKFAYLNCCGASEIKEFFTTHRAPHIQISTDKLQNFYREKLNDYLNLTDIDIINSTTENYLYGGAEEMLSASHLRFCPDCIEYGYHSPIHQLLFIDKCPCHDTKILDSCIYCGRKKFIKISSGEFNSPYSCNYCHKPLFAHIEQLLSFRYNNAFRTDVENCFGGFSRDLIHQKATRGSLSKHIAFVKMKVGENYISNYLYDINCLINCLMNNSNDVYVYSEPVADVKYDEPPDLRAIYRSVRVMILKKTLGKHRKCVKWLLQIKVSSNNSVTESIKNLCLYALAFVLWRMYFEEANSPHKLLMKRYNTNYRLSFEELLPGDMSNCLAERYFAMLCVYVFRQSLMVASAMIVAGSLDFDRYKIQLRPGPPISNTSDGVEQRVIRIFTRAQERRIYAFNRNHYLNSRKASAEINSMTIAWLHKNYSGFHPRSG